MSEVYNFKPLSEVESLESTTDATKILAVDNGTVKQIPASAVGGSGGGSFVVTLTVNAEDGSITGADKTYAEILEAFHSGIVPFARYAMEGMGGYLLPLVAAMESEGVELFVAVTMEAGVAVTCTADNTWQFMG